MPDAGSVMLAADGSWGIALVVNSVSASRSEWVCWFFIDRTQEVSMLWFILLLKGWAGNCIGCAAKAEMDPTPSFFH